MFLYDFIKFSVFTLIIYLLISPIWDPWKFLPSSIFFVINSILFCYVFSFIFQSDKNSLIMFVGILALYTGSMAFANINQDLSFPEPTPYSKNKKFIYNPNDISPVMSAFQYSFYLTNYLWNRKTKDFTDLSLYDIYLNMTVSFLISFVFLILLITIIESRIILKIYYTYTLRNNKISCDTDNKYIRSEKEKVNSTQMLTVRIKELTKIYKNMFSKNTKAVDNVYN
jgi:hypothetical protein